MAPGSRLQELTAKYMQNPRRFFVPLANEYRVSGDLDRAIALCREHLPAQPGHMSGHIVLGRAYYEKGDHEAARDVFLTSVSLDDENLIALRHLGDIASGHSAMLEARGWYARVLDADPENREIQDLLRTLDVPDDEVAGTNGAAEVGASAHPVAAAETLDPLADSASQSDGFGELTSALADPTPPGLRAILGEESAPAFAADLVRVPEAAAPSVGRPLETFDLSTLGAAVEEEVSEQRSEPSAGSAAEQFGFTVEDGGGFAFSDLDEMVDPATASVADTLPPVEDADFTSGVETPTVVPVQPADDLLSRPVFGALASFASWRTAQGRETPASVPIQSAPADAPAASETLPLEETDAYWREERAEAADTAPEFVTETMAALYAQQGFTRQAYDVYRALLERSPGDAALTGKMLELQAALEMSVTDASLQEDADTALQFTGFSEGGADMNADASALEAMYEVSPPDVQDPFGSAWTPASDEALSGGDDWFADVVDGDPIEGSPAGDAGIFGLGLDGLDAEGGIGSPVAPGEEAERPHVSLAAMLGGTAVAAADETAADMLLALAAQMVGRLPKEPPTLPVPDVLELPTAVAGDDSTGASPAPLLSFDRFFSGSGSPPRPRIDTPVRAPVTTPRNVPPVTPIVSPSLSPTFGGVPVISPRTATPAPTWAGFDRFVPPTPGASSTLAAGSASTPPVSPTPTGTFWTPAAVPVVPSTPEPQRQRPVTPVAPPVQRVTPVAPQPAAEPPVAESNDDEAPRTPPSDFHRWLEGLS